MHTAYRDHHAVTPAEAGVRDARWVGRQRQ
jgi:hypothetical protein